MGNYHMREKNVKNVLVGYRSFVGRDSVPSVKRTMPMLTL